MKPLFSVTGLHNNVEGNIDIESEPDVTAPIYDVTKAKALMEECEKHAAVARNYESDEIWEEKITKTTWSTSQHRLFNGFVNILNNFYLAKLAQTGVNNEPVLRRTVIDKAVQRVRYLFATVSYDPKLLQWLHQLLVDNLDQQNLASYLDILQTLKSKIPKLFEKLLHSPNAGVRVGPLSNENLLPLLKRSWDPVATSLVQDKPKKLPGNTVIVLMPCNPDVSKRNQKWMSLLSNLGHVVTVPTNFGSASHRMTMTNCIDQMFALARGKIQEVRESFPGRHIILVGRGAGATLAIQIGQVENVFCIVSLGFSLLTAEGKRGEPDDGLLELHCPVLFVIGQCSSTTFQEDMEDLRERMRIETGLIVVGSADNNLIVTKKKRREEGITQSIVDRCIIDEIGEFISGLILSPFPPQVRQSPTNIPSDVPTKKCKIERKRYNSNTSSVESEPPSPTPRRSRPVGRPAGKTKCKLEAKWAAQVAQGITPSPSPSSNSVPPISSLTPPPLILKTDLNCTTPTSSSDTASAASDSPPSAKKLEDAQHTKKIKIMKPVVIGGGADKAGQKADNVGGTDQARMQAYNLTRNVMPGGQLSTLLQGGIKTIPPVQQKQPTTSSPSTIKVLENVQLSTQATAKLITNTSGRIIDLSKIGIAGQRSTGSNVVLLPDGKIKTVTPSKPVPMKGAIATPMVLSRTQGQPKGTKYITSKRMQSPKIMPVKRQQPFLTFPQPIKTNLPPPTNLTSQDIMDLPIIFADDNQILDPNMPTDLSTTSSSKQPMTKFISPTPTNKFMIVTKPTTSLSNFIVTPSTVKRPNPVPVVKQPTKYTKIILSKKSTEPITAKIPGNMPVSNVTASVEQIDLENELVATAVPKPNVVTPDRKLMGVISKKGGFTSEEQVYVDDDDPDYIPPKNLKI